MIRFVIELDDETIEKRFWCNQTKRFMSFQFAHLYTKKEFVIRTLETSERLKITLKKLNKTIKVREIICRKLNFIEVYE